MHVLPFVRIVLIARTAYRKVIATLRAPYSIEITFQKVSAVKMQLSFYNWFKSFMISFGILGLNVIVRSRIRRSAIKNYIWLIK